MTTLSALRDAWDIQYKQQCLLRNTPEVTIPDNTFKLYFDMTMVEMSAELGITDAIADLSITPVTVYTVYDLGYNFGGLRSTEIIATNGEVITSDLELKYITEVPTVGSLIQGTPSSISIFKNSSDQKFSAYLYPLSGFTGTLRIRYKYIPIISQSPLSSLGATTLTIPDTYIPTLLDGIMSKVFFDMYDMFRAKLERMRLMRATPVKPSLEYNLGFPEE